MIYLVKTNRNPDIVCAFCSENLDVINYDFEEHYDVSLDCPNCKFTMVIRGVITESYNIIEPLSTIED